MPIGKAVCMPQKPSQKQSKSAAAYATIGLSQQALKRRRIPAMHMIVILTRNKIVYKLSRRTATDNTSMKFSLFFATVIALSLTSCWRQEQDSEIPRPSDWRGTVTVDSAGDIVALQGNWNRISRNTGELTTIKQTLSFNMGTVTFTTQANETTGIPSNSQIYNYIINSNSDPKILVILGPSQPNRNLPESWWYRLNGDILILFNHWTERREAPPQHYKRLVKPA